jgi:hypothetical protein
MARDEVRPRQAFDRDAGKPLVDLDEQRPSLVTSKREGPLLSTPKLRPATLPPNARRFR